MRVIAPRSQLARSPGLRPGRATRRAGWDRGPVRRPAFGQGRVAFIQMLGDMARTSTTARRARVRRRGRRRCRPLRAAIPLHQRDQPGQRRRRPCRHSRTVSARWEVGVVAGDLQQGCRALAFATAVGAPAGGEAEQCAGRAFETRGEECRARQSGGDRRVDVVRSRSRLPSSARRRRRRRTRHRAGAGRFRRRRPSPGRPPLKRSRMRAAMHNAQGACTGMPNGSAERPASRRSRHGSVR